jgi:hypothetical protein
MSRSYRVILSCRFLMLMFQRWKQNREKGEKKGKKRQKKGE